MSEGTLARPVAVRTTADAPRKVSFRWARPLVGLIVPVLLLLLWQIMVWRGVYNTSQLPAPANVLRAAQQLWNLGELQEHIKTSLIRVAQGFAVGAGIAIALGLLVGLSRVAESLLGPTLSAFRAIPSLAWVPLLVLWMGIDERPKITLIAIGVFFPVYATLVAGIRQIDRRLIEAATAYGYAGPALAKDVLLPAALPSLFTGLRAGLAQGWLFLVAAELIAASAGLGFMLIDGQNSGRADVIVLAIIVLALLGKLTDSALAFLERRLLRWTDTYKGA